MSGDQIDHDKHLSEAPAEKVDHPQHYNAHPSGVECIDIVEAFSFNIGNAMKYIWRAGIKTDDATEDLRKAAWYLDRELVRLSPLPIPTGGEA